MENDTSRALLRCTMKLKMQIAVVLMLSLLAAASDYDFPQPPPVKVFNITDVGDPGAPVRFGGTANAYASYQQSGSEAGNYVLWVETLGLTMTNVSSKPIVAVEIYCRWWDTRGWSDTAEDWKLDLSGMDTLNPGRSWKTSLVHIPGPRHIMTKGEYEKGADVFPAAKAHVLSV